MTSSARKIAVLIAFVIATSAQVVTAAPEFYSNLLRRGVSEFNAGRYASAATLLRTAAFGLLDSIDQFETAQAYVAVASQRLGRDDEARHATRRILMAERVQRRFAALPLPPELRSQFEGVAARYLTAGERAALFDANAKVPQRPAETTVRRRTLEQAPAPATESKSPPPAPATVVAEPPTVVVVQPPASEPVAKAVPVEPEVTEEPQPHNLVEETPAPAPTTTPAPQPVAERPVVPAESVPTEPVPAEPAPAQTQAVEPVPPTVVEPKTVPQPVVTNPTVAQPEPVEAEPAARTQPVEEPPQPESKDQSVPTQPAPPVPEPERVAPEPAAEPAVPAVSVPEPPVTTSPTPSAEAVREAQREFERKVAEVERSEPAPSARNASAREVARTLEEASAALDGDDILGARAKLRDVFAVTNLRRDDVLKIAEEAYRARDFALSVDAFARAGALGRGEEALGYYLAVALYETGKYGEAKAALAAALPHIELTDVVSRYRAKIEGAVE